MSYSIIKSFKKNKKSFIIKSIIFIIFLIYSVSLVYPFIWMAMNSLKTKFEFYGNVFAFPKTPQWVNFKNALVNFNVTAGAGDKAREVNMITMFITSILLVIGATFLDVFLSAIAAYTVCFYKFPLRKVVFSVVIFALVVPLAGTLPAMYKFMNDTKMFNTIPGIMFLYANGFGFSFLLLYGSYKNLSWNYAEAAAIDGAGHFRIFFQVMLPLSLPSITAAGVIALIGFWNDYTTPAIFLPRFPTVAVGVHELILKMQQLNEYPLLFSVIIMATLPIIIFFACFQKTIMKNMVAGGLKG